MDGNREGKRTRPALRLKRDIPKKACPGCRKKIEEDAVVCNYCGWDFRTGKKSGGVKLAMPGKKALGMALKSAVALAVAGVLAAGVHWAWKHREAAEHWLGEGKERVLALSGSVAGGAGTDQADREAVEREKLDRELPMWEIGDNVMLEKRNGAVLAGVLRGVAGGMVTVETPDETQMVEADDLSGRSRVRVDGTFRENVIRARAENE